MLTRMTILVTTKLTNSQVGLTINAIAWRRFDLSRLRYGQAEESLWLMTEIAHLQDLMSNQEVVRGDQKEIEKVVLVHAEGYKTNEELSKTKKKGYLKELGQQYKSFIDKQKWEINVDLMFK
jgi:hypothetical protein